MPESTNSSNINRTNIQLVSSTLSGLSKNELTNRDIFGRTILHILILANRYDLLRNLLKNPDVRLLVTLTDYENGWNCLHYVIFHKRLSCYKVLINYLQNLKTGLTGNLNNSLLLEMLRCKDRNKVTPLQLLDNDFKDLVWVPEYIDENNEYHLSYRFQGAKDSDGGDNENNEEIEKILTNKRPFVRQKHNWSTPERGGSDIYMFGSNKNNNLGVGDATDRAIPSKISHECFKTKGIESQNIQTGLMKPRYRMVKISKNHSIVLTYDGSLYSCGIGSRGRLGHGFNDLNNTFRFKKINFYEFNEDDEDNGQDHAEQVIKDVAISSNHSIALNNENEIYSWGLNNFNQLGYTSSIASSSNSVSNKTFLEPFEGQPKEIISGDLKRNQSPINGLAVSKIHSVAYTRNELFFWGLCIGQMGIPIDSTTTPIEHKVNNTIYKGFIQRSPKRVALRDDIKYVLTSETCTCVISSTNDIHIFYQYQHFKLPKIPVKGSTDKHFDLFKPTKLTQAIKIEKVCLKSHQFIALLLDNGDVMSFSLSHSENDDGSSKGYKNLKYASLWKSYDRDMKVIDIDVSNDGSIILCTRNGSAFIKTHSSQRKNSMSEVSLSVPALKNKFKKIESLNKVIKVSCDDNFLSFGFIRDDIDLIPFELQSNDFLKDMEYLSCLSDIDFARKQKQLLNSGHKHSSYISDYLYSQRTKANVNNSYHSIFPSHQQEDEEELDEMHTMEDNEYSKNLTYDILYNRYISRYDFQKNKRIKLRNTYLHTSRAEDEILMNLLKSDILYLSYKLAGNSESNKRYNCSIKFAKFPDISIKIHKEIFIKRSPFCAKIFNPTNAGEYFIEGGVEGRYSPDENELVFTNNINIKSVLIITHFIYSNRVLSIWDDFPGGLNCPSDIKEIRQDFDKLSKLFLVTDLLGKLTKDEVYLKKVQALINDKQNGDVIIRLKDGDITCHSYILIARSAFFETVLSERWDNQEDTEGLKVLTLGDVSVFQFELILRHLYGYNDLELFDCLNEKTSDNPDIDEFINCLLELIEISDELLLLQLKNLCQLGIKDFISLENVLILLMHAHYLGATKLFMNCCWFIYNNLDAILFDPSFREIPDDLLKELERQAQFFQYCKLIDFAENCEKVSENSLKNWMELQSNSLIFDFLNNIKEHNEVFISDKRGFEGFDPVIDIKYNQRKPTQESSKKKKDGRSHSVASRKNSTISNIQANLVDFRKIAATKNNENEEALDDSEDGFEVVNKRRQNSKSDNIRPASVLNSTSPTPPPSQSPSRSSSIVDVPNIQPTRKTSLPGSAPTKPLMVTKETQCNPRLSPHSNWATKSNAGTLIDKQPVLGKGLELQTKEQQSLSLKKNSKLKFGPSVRLSQKERKKMASQITPDNNSNEEVSKILNPWSKKDSIGATANNSDGIGLPTLGSLSRSSKHEDNTKRKNSQIKGIVRNGANNSSGTGELRKSDLPKLGNADSQAKQGTNQIKSSAYSSMALNVNKPVNKVYSTPSLTEIMIHESLKIEEAKIKETERKTLQEIQQEQQFAKWWEEEALRIQRQMSQMEINGRVESGSSTKHNSGTNKTKKSRNTKPKRSSTSNSDSAYTPNNKTQTKHKNATKE